MPLVEEVCVVECMKGHPGILEEGKLYSVLGYTKEGNYHLYEAQVPEGYTSFNKDRFRVVETKIFEFEEEFSNEYEGQ